MFQVQKLFGNNLLAQRVESEPRSEFETGQSESSGPVFVICHAGDKSAYKPDDLVLLKPGEYDRLNVGGQQYFVLTDDEIIGNVKEQK